jgi:hypothetical protein
MERRHNILTQRERIRHLKRPENSLEDIMLLHQRLHPEKEKR